MKYIKLTQGKYAIVSDEDFEWLNQSSWHFIKDGYAAKYPSLKMQNEIWEHHFGPIPEGKIVDHIDNNGLHNEISNLRLATPKQNCQNRSISSLNTSGYKGVSYHKKIGRHCNPPWEKEYWLASIRTDEIAYTKHFPFSGEGLIQAALWYDDKATELWREYAWLNFPDEETRPEKKTIAEIDNLKPKGESGFFGVTKSQRKGKNSEWLVRVTKDKKTYTKSYSATEDNLLLAACYYDLKAKQLYGKDVKHLNFPLGIPLQVTLEELEEIPRPKSGYFGVTKVKNGGCKPVWLVRVTPKGKKSYSKTFPFTEEGLLEAAHHYDKKAKELLGKKAKRLNFPDDK